MNQYHAKIMAALSGRGPVKLDALTSEIGPIPFENYVQLRQAGKIDYRVAKQDGQVAVIVEEVK